MAQLKNFPGEKFGRLKIIRRDNAWAVCLCDCGSPAVKVLMGNLKSGRTKSCGCLLREFYMTKAGHHIVDLTKFKVEKFRALHSSMKQRCYNPKNAMYKLYGKIGVRVCAEWQEFEPFAIWLTKRWEAGKIMAMKKGAGEFSPDTTFFTDRAGVKSTRKGKAIVSSRTDDGLKLTALAKAGKVDAMWLATKLNLARARGEKFTSDDAKRVIWERAVGLIK